MALANISVSIPELGATFTASLIPIRQSSKPVASFTSICPNCETATKVNQVYVCPVHEGTLKKGELAKAREVSKGNLVKVTKEEIDAIKEPTLPANQLELTAFPSVQVSASTQPDDTGYFIGVTEGSTAKMLFDLLTANPGITLVGELTLGTSQKMFRLTTWNQSLFLQQLIRPTEVAAGIVIGGADYKEKLFPVYEQLLQESVEDFNPAAFESKVKARIAQLDSENACQVGVTERDVNNATLDELEALLASKKATKAKTTKLKAGKKAA